MTSQSNVDPQSLFNEQADNKGKSGNAKADKRHLPETLFKIQVLGDRNIISKHQDYQHHSHQHRAQSVQIMLVIKNKIGQYQQRHGNAVSNAGINAGLKSILASFAAGRKKFRRSHR